MVTDREDVATCAESKVDVYKRLTLGYLRELGDDWCSFEDVAADLDARDGDVDRDALFTALNELVRVGNVCAEKYAGVTGYRIAPPQEGENLAEKLKRLEAENAELRIQVAAFDLAKEQVDKAVERAAAVLRLREENERLRDEQAADRAAVMALVEMLPLCDEPGCLEHATCGYAGEEVLSIVRFCDVCREDGCVDRPEASPLRVLQARMATWPSATGSPEPGAAVVDDVQAGSLGLTFEEAARRYPEAFERALDTVAGRADEIAAGFDAADPKWHWLLAALKRRYPKVSAQEMTVAELFGPSKVGGAYAEQLGAPKGCLCTWHVQPTFVGDPVVHRGRGVMPCPVHADAENGPEWHRQPPRVPRYIGEFGDIDEPSVGDVDGYGRRG